jgi:formiminotetrahydrofolate cyclodeaminase
VAYEAVRHEAEQRGVQVCSSELIGLVPQQALIMASEFFLKLERFDPTQVLETRLEKVLQEQAPHASPGPIALEDAMGAPLHDFLDALSAGTPAPGGGSAAALAGALAAALGVMACRISATEPRHDPDMAPLERRLTELDQRLRGLVQADAEAYAGVVAAYRLARTDPARQQAIASSLRLATEVPLETAVSAEEAVSILCRLSTIAKPTVASDLRVGLILGLAAIDAALENVRVNLESLKDEEYLREVSRRVEAIKQSVVELRSL